MSKHDLMRLDAIIPTPEVRHDAPSAFVKNELTQIVPEMYDVIHEDLDAREHIPVDTSINEGAPAWGYDSMDGAGKAKIIGANVSDIPRVDVSKERFTFPIRSSGAAYGWSFEEIRAAQWLGMPLDRRKAMEAKRAQDELEHEILLNGSPSHNIPGLLTNPAIGRVIVPNGAWTDATAADDMLADMAAPVREVLVRSRKVHRANRLLMDLASYDLAQHKRIPDSSETVLSFFQRTHPGLEVKPLLEMESAGASGGKALLAYQLDRRNLKGCIPMPFTQHPAETRGMEVVVTTEQRHGGCVVFYPLAFAFGDGI